MTPNRDRLLSLAERAIAADRDHMIAEGAKLDWLIAQLANWPTRVDEAKTINQRFLMMSAAATLRALADAPDTNRVGEK